MSADARQLRQDDAGPDEPRGYDPLELPRLHVVGGKAVRASDARRQQRRNGEGYGGGSQAGGGGHHDGGGHASPEELEATYRRGVADGIRQGQASAGQQSSTALEALSKAVELFNSSQEQLLRERERDLHALAVAVAEKILQREVKADPTIVTGLVQKALELLPADTTLEIRLNPQDLQALQNEIRTMTAPSRGMHIEWSSDPTLDRGSFLMETPLRLINGRADIALRELYERMDRYA